MSIKILPPNEDRKEFFEKSVKPLLIAAEENNAFDKWMFNLKDDGEVNRSSVVFVSAVKKMIFLIAGMNETIQPTKPPPYVEPDIVKKARSRLSEDQIKHFEKESQRVRDRLEYRWSIFRPKEDPVVEVIEEKKDGSFETRLETWHARIEVYDISNRMFVEKEIFLQGTDGMPNIEGLCQDLDIQHLFEIAKRSWSSKVSYQSVSSNWKMNKEY